MKKMDRRYGLNEKALSGIPVDLRPMLSEMETAC